MTNLQDLCRLGLGTESNDASAYEHRVFTVRDKIIEHPEFTRAVRAIAGVHERWIAAKLPGAILIYGQSGAGKSTVLRYYLGKFPRQITPRKIRIPVLRIVTPEAPTVRSFTEAILVALGDMAASKGSAAVKTQRIMHFIKECEVQVILIDEFHHFCDSNKSERRRVTDWLKNLINECGVPVILFGLPRAISALYSNEQLRRRFAAPLHLKEFGFQAAEEQTLFRGVLAHLQSLVPRKSGLDISQPEVAMRFHFATNGLIDYVIKIVDELVVSSPDGESTEISFDRLQEAFRTQIWSEAPDKLNPFNPKVKPRRLHSRNEPFAVWDDPSAYTLSSRSR
ncbi:TniB family NTP-binding protein [Paracidovorax wautersii]|uniref:AAA+ ATPase domain-containing protein n=1 Tax=Paracidovorax wautersii TaxID=1177982 RepID=A0ABU1I945_9BURK|nr:TniB family NTP-binding protein [Paracidovorax wautersii]MDR6213620.1 hypothetical protein [Paracidovorax wautersii]